MKTLTRRGRAVCGMLTAMLTATPAFADPYLGEIRCFAFNFAPHGWVPTNGQILPISSNTALFSLLGTTYGGDGRSTFALPNLQQRVVIGTSDIHPVGDAGGSTSKAITLANLPTHTHLFAPLGASASADSDTPAGRVPAVKPRTALYVTPGVSTGNVAMVPATTSSDGGSPAPAPLPNMAPYLTFSCAIAVAGVFPSRD